MKKRIRGLVNCSLVFGSSFLFLSRCASISPDAGASASRDQNVTSLTSSSAKGSLRSTPLKKDERARVILLYVSDLHGRLRPEPSGLGGYARLATLIRDEKSAAGDQTDVVAILGGDAAGKSSLPCRKSEEKECFALLSQLGFDFAVLGYWELKRSARDLNELVKISGLKWISANVRSLDGKSSWVPSLDFAGPRSKAKLEFLSWTLTPSPEEVDYAKAKLDVREKMTDSDWIVWEKKAKGKSVVFVPHLEYAEDVKILQTACTKENLKPVILLKANDHAHRDEKVDCARLVEPGPFGTVLSKAELNLGSDGKWFVKTHEFISIDSRISEDALIKEKVESLYQKYAPMADVVMATASRDYSQVEFAKWAGESFRKVAHSDIAVVNLGAIKESVPAGPITQERLTMVYPYVDDLMGFDVNSREFEKSLCMASRRERDPIKDHGAELVLVGAEIENPGTDRCQIKGPRRASYKVAMVSYLVKRSKRWLGRDYSPIAFKWQVRTDQAMQKMIEASGKKL